MLGDRARAGKVFAAALDALEAEQDNGLSRPDYGSTLRDAAATLALVAEAESDHGELPGDPIAPRRRRARARARARAPTPAPRRTTGWRSPPRRSPSSKALSQFTVDGQPVEGAIYRKWSGFALGQKLVTIANAGKATAQLVTTASGVPLAHEPAASAGLRDRAQRSTSSTEPRPT